MAESTLSLAYNDLMQEVGGFVGFGRLAYAEYTDTDKRDWVDAIIQAGLRQFYYPENGYEWSFFHPFESITVWATTTGAVSGQGVWSDPSTTITVSTGTLYPSMVGKSFVFGTSGTGYTITSYTSSTVVVVSGNASGEASGDTYTITADGSYRFPDDFAGIASDLTFAAGEGWPPIPVVGEHQIRQAQAATSTGKPWLAALRPVEFDPTVGQRFELLLYPTPGSAYVLGFATNAMPNKLDTTNKYPVGGMRHSETILESCLAVAEERMEDNIGFHRARFERLLMSSIAADARTTAPRSLGYNHDRSSAKTIPTNRIGSVTYYDVQY